jgi:hypothetical protein
MGRMFGVLHVFLVFQLIERIVGHRRSPGAMNPRLCPELAKRCNDSAITLD